MNINEMTFGVEIECYLPLSVIDSEGIRIGSYFSSGIQVPGLPIGFVAKEDGSLRNTCPVGFRGIEIVSPILKGADGLRQVVAVCDWLHARNVTVNRACGLHVHVGWTGTDEALGRLVASASNLENALYGMTGSRERARGVYCKPVNANPELLEKFRDGQKQRAIVDRFCLLNLTNLNGTRKRTVEFRCFAGTTNSTKICGYVRVCLGIAEKAIVGKRSASWGRPLKKNGQPRTAVEDVERLMQALNFGKLYWADRHGFGALEGFGLPTSNKIKKELFRLAAKYDASL